MKIVEKKEQLVASRVPQKLLADLKKIEKAEHLDRSTNIRRLLYSSVREWKLANAARMYSKGKVSLGAAAREAGTTVREMMDYLSERKVPYQYGPLEFDQDLKRIHFKAVKKR